MIPLLLRLGLRQVYLLDDGRVSTTDGPRWCPLLRKGVYVSKAEDTAAHVCEVRFRISKVET